MKQPEPIKVESHLFLCGTRVNLTHVQRRFQELLGEQIDRVLALIPQTRDGRLPFRIRPLYGHNALSVIGVCVTYKQAEELRTVITSLLQQLMQEIRQPPNGESH
jgi:hypothetical protein